ncbi:hypothetical protein GQ54DRAFT_102313 [Martensiomyces pterosporus]|nr:hypothetical protein GQ54DRAFT_102313 [Martensiomyces pterosporus]
MFGLQIQAQDAKRDYSSSNDIAGCLCASGCMELSSANDMHANSHHVPKSLLRNSQQRCGQSCRDSCPRSHMSASGSKAMAV